MPAPVVLRTETAAYCPTCGHESANHPAAPGSGCCMNWCPCQHTRSQVAQHDDPRDRQVFASPWSGS